MPLRINKRINKRGSETRNRSFDIYQIALVTIGPGLNSFTPERAFLSLDTRACSKDFRKDRGRFTEFRRQTEITTEANHRIHSLKLATDDRPKPDRSQTVVSSWWQITECKSSNAFAVKT
jgi:hypothetical protein